MMEGEDEKKKFDPSTLNGMLELFPFSSSPSIMAMCAKRDGKKKECGILAKFFMKSKQFKRIRALPLILAQTAGPNEGVPFTWTDGKLTTSH